MNASKQSRPISNRVSQALVLRYAREGCLHVVLLLTIPLAV